jgi:uncharacterized protein (UPF0332 family)
MPGAFNPKRFLVLAKKILLDNQYDEDCRIRTAMGRIYYATFLVALRRLEREGIKITNIDTVHKGVIQAYMEYGFTDIGGKLDQLRERRVDADYHMLAEIALNECKGYAQLSERTIDLIEQIQVFR